MKSRMLIYKLDLFHSFLVCDFVIQILVFKIAELTVQDSGK